MSQRAKYLETIAKILSGEGEGQFASLTIFDEKILCFVREYGGTPSVIFEVSLWGCG